MPKKPYRILTFDGGGIRGIYSSALLERLVSERSDLIQKTDLFAGTSTGGIIALLLANGAAPADVTKLYFENGKKIFDDSWIDDLKDVGGLIGSDYDNRNLKQILTGVFGSKKLKDLKSRVLIPAFNLDNKDEKSPVRSWKPKFFHNFPGDDSDGDELVVDVAMRTSAAPTFFQTYGTYIDGGVVANNPSMAALAQAIDKKTGGHQLSEVSMLSLSTGFNPTFIKGENLDWGLAQWAKPLVSLMIDGVMGVADYQCKRLLGDRYFRLWPVFPEAIDMDAVQKTGRLIELAKTVDIREAVKWLVRNF